MGRVIRKTEGTKNAHKVKAMLKIAEVYLNPFIQLLVFSIKPTRGIKYGKNSS
jgi:hypothetical protein